MNNISCVVLDDLCTGCGTCTSLCPKKAIKMILNIEKGIFQPELNKELCNNCGICYKVCPGHEVDFNTLNIEIFGQLPEDPFIGNYTDCYTGNSTDDEIRFNSSSGGLITQFLIYALEKKVIDGALVTRMSKDNPLLPEPFIARTKAEIIKSSTSKYCPVPANIALKKILDAPPTERFAVVGLPCHIHGIKKAESVNKYLKQKIVLHLGIICGTTKTINGTYYQLERMNIPRNKVKEIKYRGEGWPGKLTVTLKNDQSCLVDLMSYYDGEFCSFIPNRCSICSDHTCELSDLSFGDAWIDEIKKKDNKGTSILVNRNKLCYNLLNEMNEINLIELKEIDKILVAKSQGNYYSKKREINARFRIMRLFGRKLPIYNQISIPNKKIDYLWSIWYYLWIFVSSKRYFWGLFKLKMILGKIFS